MIMYVIITALAAAPPGDVLIAAHGLLPLYHVPGSSGGGDGGSGGGDGGGGGGGNALLPGGVAPVPGGGGGVGGGGKGSDAAAHVKRPNEVY